MTLLLDWPDVNVFQVTKATKAADSDGSFVDHNGHVLLPGWYWAQFYPGGNVQGPFNNEATAQYAARLFHGLEKNWLDALAKCREAKP